MSFRPKGEIPESLNYSITQSEGKLFAVVRNRRNSRAVIEVFLWEVMGISPFGRNDTLRCRVTKSTDMHRQKTQQRTPALPGTARGCGAGVRAVQVLRKQRIQFIVVLPSSVGG